MTRWAWQLVPALVSVVVVTVLGAAIILALGQDPWTVGGDALGATLFTGYGLFQVLFKATPLMLCGLAVWVPLSAGLFNVGGEGQLLVGGLCAAAVGQGLCEFPGVGFPAALLAAALGGALAGALAGLLKHRWGVHEVVTTIMLNFVFSAGCGWMLQAHLAQPGTSHSMELPSGILFSRLGEQGSLLSTSCLMALALALLWDVVMARSRFGLEVRLSGASPVVAKHSGVSPGFMLAVTLGLGGAMAGLAGAHYVLGARRFFEEGMSGGEGFLGIAVALLARARPAAVVPAALLFALLSQAGMALGSTVPRELVLLLQGVVVVVLSALSPWLERRAVAQREAA